MAYSFRIRINRSPTDTIQCAKNELSVSVADKRLSIILRARQDDLPIRDSDQLALVGSRYETENDANTAGSRLQDVLMVALARVRVGADFGHRAAKGMFTHDGLKWVSLNSVRHTHPPCHEAPPFATYPDLFFRKVGSRALRVP